MASSLPSFTSYDTALCVLPPAHLVNDIDRLRALHDKAYGKWPAHINLIYPFVAVESLPQTLEIIRATLSTSDLNRVQDGVPVRLNSSDYFAHKRSWTVFVTETAGDNHNQSTSLSELRKSLWKAFDKSNDNYRLHLTIGQSNAQDESLRQYLLDKAALLPSTEWQVGELVVLVREHKLGPNSHSSRMIQWGSIGLCRDFPIRMDNSGTISSSDLANRTRTHRVADPTNVLGIDPIQTTSTPGVTYQFSNVSERWEPSDSSTIAAEENQTEDPITISTYNVLTDSPYPPPRDRLEILMRNILADDAIADILVLQEVSDDFLSFLLGHEEMRAYYPYTSHGPSTQDDIGPLTSLRNIVILSRVIFSWEWISFEKRHKGSVVAKFHSVGKTSNAKELPLVLAGVHLTCGLSDSSVAAKHSQLKTVLNFLSKNYAENPWIVAGDFNIPTSSYTVDAALKKKAISPQTAETLISLETMITESGLCDAWFAARVQTVTRPPKNRGRGDLGNVYEGEEGATFDPTENPLAADITGRSYHSRPQRYDRILVRGEGLRRVVEYNLFGFPEEISKDEENSGCGSDHWGIRTSIQFQFDSEDSSHSEPSSVYVAAPNNHLSDVTSLKACLEIEQMFPSEDDINHRRDVFSLVKAILQQIHPNSPSERSKSNITFVVVPVGSYRLGVWNASSDIDCLAIGPISPKVFFAVATHQLRRAADMGVRILRKVKAASGIMLEMEVQGIKLDLQYCAAATVVERWPQVLDLPPSDPAFDLPMQSLVKLNCFRDLDYLQRTIPDLAAFRLAYRVIKAWAKQRGIYASRLGYLGGIHITLLLSRICKLLFRHSSAATVPEIVCTFFKHYAKLDWQNNIVYDPFFYGQEPRYHRTSREPIVILGIHAPKVNVAHTASLPSVVTLVEEIVLADNILSSKKATWYEFLGETATSGGVVDFLNRYNAYIKINVQYWGMSSAKGKMLVGWLESRCVSLLVETNRKFPELQIRIWPARFTSQEHLDGGENETEYQGCYLFGLRHLNRDSESSPEMSNPDRRSAQVALQSVLNKFAEQIRADENYFDSTSCWVDIGLAKRSDVCGLLVDNRDWVGVVTVNDEADSDVELVEEECEIRLPGNDELPTSYHSIRLKGALSPRSGGEGTVNKLRPAGDVLSRLRWDPHLSSGDYVIGYEDRFAGLRETPIDRWKLEQTHEEFIPQHRIVYFKRKSDGHVIWDRTTKRDEVFGSGAGKEQRT